MSEHILKRHNKTLILYHIVCPAKYRQKVFTERVELSLQNICIEIGKQYEIHFVEIGTDKDHVHFLVQSVTVMSPSRVVQIIKTLLERKYSNITRRSKNCCTFYLCFITESCRQTDKFYYFANYSQRFLLILFTKFLGISEICLQSLNVAFL